MTVKELIDNLKGYDENLEVTTSDKKGLFQAIDKVELQEWSDDTFSSVTLVLGKYDNRKCIVNQNKLSENRFDNEFIDNLNQSSNDKIDKNEAFKLKGVFVDDYQKYQDSLKYNVAKKYEYFKYESLLELFGDGRPLEEYSFDELRKLVKVEWRKELFNDEFNNKTRLLVFLYGKLNDTIRKKILNSLNVGEKDFVANYNINEKENFNGLIDTVKKLTQDIKDYNKELYG